jgi:hypothetical protein
MLRFLTPSIMAACLFTHAAQADDPSDFFRNGHFFGELRYQYETDHQDGTPNGAPANTLRADLGFETGLYRDLTARVDYQVVRHITTADDPERSQFREAWLMWTGLPDTSAKGGRQEILFDNERFVGNADFSQSDVSFDAGRASWSPLDGLTFDYAYVWAISRTPQDWTGDNHLIHGAYAYADWLHLAAYGYILDISQNSSLSSQTYGARASGAKAVGDDLEFDYLAEYATQSDNADNPDSYRVRYWHLTPRMSWKDITAQAGFESLGGDGADAFQTPFASRHDFNGWAGMFTTTPVDGLDDRYGRLSYRLDGPGLLKDTSLDAIFHDFRAERVSTHYGNEWDFQARRSFETKDFLTKEWDVTAQFASYRADKIFANTSKFWLQVGTKF